MSLLLVPALLLAMYVTGVDSTRILVFVAWFLGQYLITAFAARSTGIRFVQNVLAVHASGEVAGSRSAIHKVAPVQAPTINDACRCWWLDARPDLCQARRLKRSPPQQMPELGEQDRDDLVVLAVEGALGCSPAPLPAQCRRLPALGAQSSRRATHQRPAVPSVGESQAAAARPDRVPRARLRLPPKFGVHSSSPENAGKE